MAWHELGPAAEIDPESDEQLLSQLTDTVIPLINRHINPKTDPNLLGEMPSVDDYLNVRANLWTPALMIPWSIGENYPRDYVWSEEDSPLPKAARSALIVGLLTEDNLPWYAETIDRKFGTNPALNFWNRLWVSEEDRHSEVMRTYMSVGKLVDPVQLDTDRIAQMMHAQVPDPPSIIEALVYVSLQELATRISHMNTGKLVADTEIADSELFPLNESRTALANIDHVDVGRLEPEERAAYIRNVGRTIMTRVAADENRHYAFYRDIITKGAIEADPSTVVKAIERQVRGFQMPGTGIRGFWEHAKVIAMSGVYDLDIHSRQIIEPVVAKHWDLENLTGLDDDAERSRERTLAFMSGLAVEAQKFVDKREQKREQHPDQNWVGKKAA
jgi:acyl-[acyl-carrier protein] desaturase